GIDPQLSRYTIEKGSVAVDGISLTINRCEIDFFEINIIVQTGKETTLLKKKVGGRVNIETDLIGKYVEKLFLKDGSSRGEKSSSGIDLEMLIRNGFGE
ncbi:MAG: riboflavin synthase, partial [Deltaproteobacteria bacterium]|nr:riboflavin synthase [Deltaproteobacteria bacterium]